MIPQNSAVLGGIPPLLVILAVKALVVPQGIFSQFVWSFEVWLVLNLFQDLVHWFSEHSVNCLRSCKPRLSSKIPSRSVIVIVVRPEISPLLRDNLTLPISLMLVFLDSLVFINAVHEPMHTPYRLLSQGFSQIMLSGQSDLKGPYSHVIKISINLIKHLLVPVQVCFQGLTFSHGHRQDRILGSRNPATRNKTRLKCSGELLKGANRTWTQTINPPHSHRPQG